MICQHLRGGYDCVAISEQVTVGVYLCVYLCIYIYTFTVN